MTNTNKDFFFISHCQEDNEVFEDTDFFDSVYANYWLDRDGMRLTDETWIDRIIYTLNNENCKGAVFYLSVNSIASRAVEREIQLVLDKRKERSDFFVIAVLLNGRTIPNLIKKVYSSLDDDIVSHEMPLSRLRTLSELFDDHKLYIRRDINNLDNYRKTLMDNLSQKGLVLNRELLENKLYKNKKLDPYSRLSFGRFYSDEIVPGLYLPKQDEYYKINGKWYIKLEDNSIHTVEIIKWIILDYQDGIVKLISERVLEKIRGRDLNKWLNTTFRMLAFDEKQKSMLVSPIRTLSFEEYDEYNKQNNINPTSDKFWLDSGNKRGQSNMLMCVNGNKVNTYGLQKGIRNGIRPVIEIKADDLFSELS